MSWSQYAWNLSNGFNWFGLHVVSLSFPATLRFFNAFGWISWLLKGFPHLSWFILVGWRALGCFVAFPVVWVGMKTNRKDKEVREWLPMANRLEDSRSPVECRSGWVGRWDLFDRRGRHNQRVHPRKRAQHEYLLGNWGKYWLLLQADGTNNGKNLETICLRLGQRPIRIHEAILQSKEREKIHFFFRSLCMPEGSGSFLLIFKMRRSR